MSHLDSLAGTAAERRHVKAGPSQRIREFAIRVWQCRVSYALVAPFFVCFSVFILVPVIAAIILSLTFFNTIEPPRFIGLRNYVTLLTEDDVFMTMVLPNTFRFAVVVGPGGYMASFILAWLVAQIREAPNRADPGALHSLDGCSGSDVADMARDVQRRPDRVSEQLSDEHRCLERADQLGSRSGVAHDSDDDRNSGEAWALGSSR